MKRFKEGEYYINLANQSLRSVSDNEDFTDKEKAELQILIKNQAKYDEIRKAGDDLALAVKALQDSGFSRNEAML